MDIKPRGKTQRQDTLCGSILKNIQNIVHAQEVNPDDGNHHQDQTQNNEQRIVQQEGGYLGRLRIRGAGLAPGLNVHRLNHKVCQRNYNQDNTDELDQNAAGHPPVFKQLRQTFLIQSKQVFIGGEPGELGFIGNAQLLHGHCRPHRITLVMILNQIIQIVLGYALIYALSIGQEF